MRSRVLAPILILPFVALASCRAPSWHEAFAEDLIVTCDTIVTELENVDGVDTAVTAEARIRTQLAHLDELETKFQAEAPLDEFGPGPEYGQRLKAVMDRYALERERIQRRPDLSTVLNDTLREVEAPRVWRRAKSTMPRPAETTPDEVKEAAPANADGGQ